MNLKKIKLQILLFLFATYSYGQVTIGSGTPPISGTLLDLKEGEVTTKGLGLPLVQLLATELDNTNYTNVSNTIKDASGEWNNQEYTGVIIYNISSSEDKCSKIADGIYMWTGDKWLEVRTVEKPEPTPPPTNPLYQPNCYVRTPNSREAIKIPVEKAFRVWEHFTSEEGYFRLGKNNPLKPTDRLSVSIVWMDKLNVIGTPTLSANTGEDAYITVPMGGAEGNAVVALKIDNIIRWSWHIWVTSDDVNNPSFQKHYNGIIWMDRNLGAINNNVNKIESIGNVYQWGRKDPFPGQAEFASNAEKTLTDGRINYRYQANTKELNFENSITNPSDFILERKELPRTTDWYALEENNVQDRWNTRWREIADDGCGNQVDILSITDPCPEGWHIPYTIKSEHIISSEDKESGVSPWAKIGTTNRENHYSYYGHDIGKRWGVNFTDPEYNLGWYPLVRIKSGKDGVFGPDFQTGYWESQINPSANPIQLATILYINGGNSSISLSTMNSPSAGLPVRCVKEE